MTFNQIAVFEFNYSPSFYEGLHPFSTCPLIANVQSEEAMCSHPTAHSIDCIVASWKNLLSSEVLDAFPALRAIFLRGTSTSRIDLSYLEKRGIHLSTISAYGDIGTSEFVVHEILRSTLGPPRREVAGKRLGLVGIGGVGLPVAKACHALGMEVFYYAPNRGKVRPSFARFLDLPDLLKTCHFISFHSPPYTPTVTLDLLSLISDDAMVLMTTLGVPADIADFLRWKRGSRASVVADLCAADGHRAALSESGVIVRDLYAARTRESIERAEAMVLQNVRTFAEGEMERAPNVAGLWRSGE